LIPFSGTSAASEGDTIGLEELINFFR